MGVHLERLGAGQDMCDVQASETCGYVEQAVGERKIAFICAREYGADDSLAGLSIQKFGGVFIAGGIVPRFLEFFKASGFRAAFEDKGRFKEYVHDIPVYLIVHDNPGLLGSGAHLRQTLGHIL